MVNEKPTLTVSEAAAALSVSERTVKRMAKDGRLEPLDLQVRRLIFARADVEALAAGGVTPPAHAGVHQVS